MAAITPSDVRAVVEAWAAELGPRRF
jgi:hypothetical protein